MAKTNNRTKGGRDRSKRSTLEARQAAYTPDRKYPGCRRMPGSTNKHKSWPH